MGWICRFIHHCDGEAPTVPSREEVGRMLGELAGVPWLVASLLYRTGTRLMECLRLRVQRVEFDRGLIVVRWTHPTPFRPYRFPVFHVLFRAAA